MFLGSFLLLKSMAVLKKWVAGAVYEALDQGKAALRPRLVPLRVTTGMKHINHAGEAIFSFAIFIHCTLISWAVLDLWSLRVSVYDDLEEVAMGGCLWFLPLFLVSTQILVLICIATFTILALGVLFIFCDAIRKVGEWDSKRTLEAFTWLFLSFVFGISAIAMSTVFFYLKSGVVLFSLSSFIDILLFVLATMGSWALCWAIRWLCLRYPIMIVYVILLPENKGGAKPSPRAVRAFSLFVINLIICTL